MLQNVSRFKFVRHLTPVPKCSKFVYGPKSDIVHNCYCVNWFFIISNIIKKLLIKKKLRIIRTTFWIYHRLENINSWLFDMMPKTKNIPYLASTTLLHLITFQPSVFCRLTLNNILMAKHLYIQHRIHSVGLFVTISVRLKIFLQS